jgi:hypothetical protein
MRWHRESSAKRTPATRSMTDDNLDYLKDRLYRGFGVEVRPDLQVRAEIILQPEAGRWVFTPNELSDLADSLNCVLLNSNPAAAWRFRLTPPQSPSAMLCSLVPISTTLPPRKLTVASTQPRMHLLASMMRLLYSARDAAHVSASTCSPRGVRHGAHPVVRPGRAHDSGPRFELIEECSETRGDGSCESGQWVSFLRLQRQTRS